MTRFPIVIIRHFKDGTEKIDQLWVDEATYGDVCAKEWVRLEKNRQVGYEIKISNGK